MIPFHFGSPERLAFGLFHPAAADSREDRAVLLCNPFGQEAVRSHRLYRVLAERLARLGLAVLRFDYHATGDSLGSDEDGDIEGWVGDTRLALRELAQRSGSQRIVCLGARLGAPIAARAASGVPGVARLVLWDPIVQGADYLALLRVKHVESLESSYSLADPQWRLRLADDPQAFNDEAIGFSLSARLRQQIRKLGPHNLPVPPGIDVQVVAHPEDAAVAAWFAPHAKNQARQLRPLAQSFDWTAEESRNSPLVPAPALATIMSTIRD